LNKWHNLKKWPKRPISCPSEVGQGMKARGNGIENHAGNVINHLVFDVLQRWQIYTNIAPQIFWLMVIQLIVVRE